MLLLLAPSGCLVTEPWSPPEKANVPPIIQADPTSAGPQIGSIVWLDAGQSPREWEFAAMVIELDEQRPLTARWRILRRGADRSNPPMYTELPLLEAGTRLRRVRIKISSNELTIGECHHLELAVSGSFVDQDTQPWREFAPRFLFTVLDPGGQDDLATASWWIWEGQSSTRTDEEKARLVESCSTQDAMPTTGAMMMMQEVQ